jgi:thiamine monophosphate synthase
MLAKKKHKHGDADVETATAVAVAAECAERGVGVRIEDHLTVAQRRALEKSAIASVVHLGLPFLAVELSLLLT